MSAIHSHTGMGPSRSEQNVSSPAMQLLTESRLAGVLDVRALAEGVSQLAQLNVQGAVQVLNDLTDVLAPLDLARLTSDVVGVVTALGEGLGQVVEGAVGGLANGVTGGVRDLLDGTVDTVARAATPLSSDLARRIDGTAVGLALTRPEPSGLGEAVDRTLGQVLSFGSRPTLAEVDPVTAAATPSAVGAATGTERTAVVGRNEATWTLDARGRLVRAEATLKEVFTDLERSSAETRAQGDVADRNVEGDHAGLIIGHRFVKDQELDNLFPQNGDFNISAYKTLENEMADWVEAGAEVRVTIDLLGGGDRPVQVRVAYEVLSAASGDIVYENTVLFRNQADQTFDRTPSSDTTGLLDG